MFFNVFKWCPPKTKCPAIKENAICVRVMLTTLKLRHNKYVLFDDLSGYSPDFSVTR